MGIRQLANELQLSIGTVSRALNDRPDVNPDTRARVKAAAAEAGYVPDQSGRSLRSGRTGIIAAVIPTCGSSPSTDSGLFAVLEGARRTFRQHALDLIVLFRGPDEVPLTNLQRIVQRRIADAVIISETTPRDPRIEWLNAAGVDYVAFGRSAGLQDYAFVDFDFETMAAEACRVFVRDGHARIAIAHREHPLNYERIILEVFRAEAATLGLDADAVQTIPLRDDPAGTSHRAGLAPGACVPTAILATHESLAAALYAELASMGLRIGADVSLLCTFPALDTRSLTPALSFFDADLDHVGVALAEQLIARSPEAPAGFPTRRATLLPLRFTPRASHGPGPNCQGVIQTALRAEDLTHASTNATPATPSSIVG